MPSVSPAQHRWIEWVRHNPEARRRSGMSQAQADEWSHADRGSPWRHKDSGGALDDGGMGPSAFGGPPGAISPFMPTMPDRSGDAWPAHDDPRIGRIKAPSSHLSSDDRGTPSPMEAGPMAAYLSQIYGGLQRTGAGGVQRRQFGGGMGVAEPSSGGILSGSANPMMQGRMQQLAQLPDEKLQELSLRMPHNPMISRALAQRHMHTAAVGSSPATGSSGILPTTAPPQQPPGEGILPQQQQRRGGTIEHRQGGGMMGMSEASPWWERSEEHGMESGYLHGSTFGRADHLTTAAPGGSYVVPADVISGVGEGNSPAGASAVQHMLNTGPWGTPLRGGRHGNTLPRPPRGVPAYRGAGYSQGEAKGGGVQGEGQGVGEPVPVKLSHGEYVIPPQRVLMIGRYLLRKHGGKGVNDKLAMKLGHDALDAWVEHERKKTIAKMKKLPGPTRATGGRLAAA
jgi:hypothetical protein